VRIILALIAALGLAPSAWAQDPAADFPKHPIRIIVCVPAGGGVDTVTRIVADGLQKRLGQPVVVENKAGAAGNIGAEAVYTSEPDGYTLLAAQPSPLTINHFLYKKMNFDPAQFEPVTIMTTVPNTLLVRPNFPAKTAKEFVDYVKANPGKINYASQGIGTTSHLTAELFATMTDTKLVHVPYRGTAPALNDLISSHVDFIFMELASAIKLHEAGRAHILAVTTAKRIPSLPDIPTLDESGVKGFESATWNAIAAPPKTPPAIVAKLNAAIVAGLADPDTRKKLTDLAQVIYPRDQQTPEALHAFQKAEIEKWWPIIKAAGIKPQ